VNAALPVLALVVCAAPPAAHVHDLVPLLRADGWDVLVVPTPAAVAWIDDRALSDASGHPVRSVGRAPGEPKTMPPIEAVAVVPATFNTINQWANGANDNQALGVLNESLGDGIPIVVAPYLKDALAQHPAFRRSVDTLRSAGVTVLDRLTSDQPPAWWSTVTQALPTG
jgi:phosphopantothenoylcysteine synthetase/decarboxylase